MQKNQIQRGDTLRILLILSFILIDGAFCFNLSNNSTWSLHSALNLIEKKVKEFKGIDININAIGIIEDSLIRNHLIVITHPAVSFGSTYLVGNDSSVFIFAYDYKVYFNTMLAKEGIQVTDFETAWRIARLFIRILLPLISEKLVFFLEELYPDTYGDLIRTNVRSELRAIERNTPIMRMGGKVFRDAELTESIFNEYKKIFKREIKRRNWCYQISKKGDFYTVSLITVGLVGFFEWDRSSEYDKRVINWTVILGKNGIIDFRLPKGIEVLKWP